MTPEEETDLLLDAVEKAYARYEEIPRWRAFKRWNARRWWIGLVQVLEYTEVTRARARLDER